VFDCQHQREVEVSIDDDVVIPESVRGLGKCPTCAGHENAIAVSGVEPKDGGRTLVLDSILMIPINA
jgi:hypothetical protein